MVIELWPDVAPSTVNHFQQLVHEGFYDGLSFHRVIPQFIVQAGCPNGDGTGGCGWTIDAELSDKPHDKGTVSMARLAKKDSASSQFFICLERENCQHLDGEYTLFGKIVEGLDTLDRIALTPITNCDTGQPAEPPVIHHATELYDYDAGATATSEGQAEPSGDNQTI
jgi:peptidyl-prolyl cis-trans isomerase B (cyclophilin B)